ncbi:hypothetical protein MCAG_01048 [Micromonospora sp. ATCC 39149]|nr:hypothetical protein MCAG_01048 [Micromonospora sp. ATCC 39149]
MRPTSGASTAIANSPWIVVSVGVVVMVVLLFVALGTYRTRGPVGEAFPAPEWTMPQPTMTLPTLPPTVSRSVTESPAPVVPGLSPRSSPSPSTARPTKPDAIPTPGGGSRSASPPAPPAPPPFTGAYRVLETYNGAFIGEVLVRNESRSSQGWTVRMTFPYANLVTAWIEGAPQGRISRSGDTWTFTSGADLNPGAAVPLRFHYDRTWATRPTACTVGNVGCSGIR